VAAWWRLRPPAAPAAGPAGSSRRAAAVAAVTAGLPSGRSGLGGALRLSLSPLPIRQFRSGDGRGMLQGGSHHGGGPCRLLSSSPDAAQLRRDALVARRQGVWTTTVRRDFGNNDFRGTWQMSPSAWGDHVGGVVHAFPVETREAGFSMLQA
jgi:hypothetical protein